MVDKMPVALLVLFLLLTTPVSAQENHFKNRTFVESSVQFWGGVTLDYASSRNRFEANSTLRDSSGRFSAGRYFALNGVGYGITLALQPKYPRAMNWIRRGMGWVHIGFGIRNFNQ